MPLVLAEIYPPGQGPGQGLCVKVEIVPVPGGGLLNNSGCWPGAKTWPVLGAIHSKDPPRVEVE